MRLISPKQLRSYAAKYPDAAEPLRKWERLVRNAEWTSIADVRGVYPYADAVSVSNGKTVTIFNIGGNKYRLITAVHYNRKRVYVLAFLTHGEYSKNLWKDKL